MARKTAPLPEVTTGNIITVGGFGGTRPSKLVEITIGDLTYLGMGADKRIYSPCGMCDNSSGYRSAYQHVQSGLCWHCAGSGIHHLFAETLEDAQKRARRIMTRRATEARKQAEKMDQVAAEKAQYASENAGQIQRVTEWLTARDLLEPTMEYTAAMWGKDEAANRAYQDAEHAYNLAMEAWYDRKDASADPYAVKLINDILGDIHMADAKKRPTAARWATAEKFMRQLEGKTEARKAEQDSSRYAGEEGEKIQITGKVIAIFDADATFGYTTTYRKGIIIKGTGEFAGITLKWIASGATQYGVDVNDMVDIKGTIKSLDEYKGVKQTVVTRCKYTVQ